MKKIITTIVVAVLVYVGLKVFDVYMLRYNLTQHMEQKLDNISEATIASSKQTLLSDALELGLELKPTDIVIKAEDTNIESYGQRVVSKTGAQYHNKKFTITIRYSASLFGIILPQELSSSKIRQVSMEKPSLQRDTQQVLDSGQ
jgi:hypothetical protein